MTADRDLQHPDITAAERTGYPRRFNLTNASDYSEEILRKFTEEMEWAFLDFCRFKTPLLEEFAEKFYVEFQEWLEEVEEG